jgi:pimeloyl-ACP methyl ester carboxylesterase
LVLSQRQGRHIKQVKSKMGIGPEEIEIKTPYFRFAAKRWGNPDGPPILGLHGWLDNAATFDRLAPLFPDAQFVSLDLAGHGHSDHRSPGVYYHYIDYVSDVVTVVDTLQWEQFALVGHSLGAGVASLVAGTIPELVSHVVLIEGIGPMSRAIDRSAQHLLRAARQMNGLPKKTPPVYDDLRSAVEARREVMSIDEDAMEAIVRRGTRPCGGGVTWRSDPRHKMVSPLYMSEDQINAFLDQITAPVLLIVGESGFIGVRDYLKGRCERIKKLKISSVPGGHYPHMDNTGAVADLISEFLSGAD